MQRNEFRLKDFAIETIFNEQNGRLPRRIQITHIKRGVGLFKATVPKWRVCGRGFEWVRGERPVAVVCNGVFAVAGRGGHRGKPRVDISASQWAQVPIRPWQLLVLHFPFNAVADSEPFFGMHDGRVFWFQEKNLINASEKPLVSRFAVDFNFCLGVPETIPIV